MTLHHITSSSSPDASFFASHNLCLYTSKFPHQIHPQLLFLLLSEKTFASFNVERSLSFLGHVISPPKSAPPIHNFPCSGSRALVRWPSSTPFLRGLLGHWTGPQGAWTTPPGSHRRPAPGPLRLSGLDRIILSIAVLPLVSIAARIEINLLQALQSLGSKHSRLLPFPRGTH
jgi:hypothetical protein